MNTREENAKYVKIIAVVIMLVEGLSGVIITAIRDNNGFQMDAVFAYWVCGLILLTIIPSRNRKNAYAFYVFEFLIWSFLSLVMSIEYRNSFIFMLSVFVIWMANMPSSDIAVYRFILIVDVLIFAFMTFALEYYTVYLFAALIIVLLVFYWLTWIYIRTITINALIARDLRQSNLDMLGLVEAKFDEAEYANTAKSAFLASMSHEIRTPITAIMGFNTMVLGESNQKEIKGYAKEIDNAGNTLLSIINDILDLSKVESGKMEIIPVEYKLSVLIRNAVNMIALKAKNKNLELVVEVDNSLPNQLFGDDVRIKQILINLLNNAVKYTEKGTITFTVDGTVKGDIAKVHFAVKDTGIGIKKEDMSKLFGDYERIEERRNRSIEGTGLGIGIATRLLNLMNSKLEVRSVYGSGSVFEFTIEQNILSKETIGDVTYSIDEENEIQVFSTEYTVPDADILVVDDNSTNILVFSNLLKHLKPRIDKAYSGEEGLNYMNSKKYDIIFLDHMMPGMDGIETLVKMREAENCINMDTPVVALTANALSGAKERYLAAGFSNYLSKPADPKRLEKMVFELISRDKIVISTAKERSE